MRHKYTLILLLTVMALDLSIMRSMFRCASSTAMADTSIRPEASFRDFMARRRLPGLEGETSCYGLSLLKMDTVTFHVPSAWRLKILTNLPCSAGFVPVMANVPT